MQYREPIEEYIGLTTRYLRHIKCDTIKKQGRRKVQD